MTKAVFIRLSVQEYEWLEKRSQGLGVVSYLRKMIKGAYDKSNGYPIGEAVNKPPNKLWIMKYGK